MAGTAKNASKTPSTPLDFFSGFNFYAFSPETLQKNIAAFNAANKVFIDSIQALSKRHQQLMHEAFDDFTNAVHDLSKDGDVKKNATKQIEIAKQTFEKSVANAGEMAEMYAKSNREAVEIFTKRASEIMDETKDQLKKG